MSGCQQTPGPEDDGRRPNKGGLSLIAEPLNVVQLNCHWIATVAGQRVVASEHQDQRMMAVDQTKVVLP